MSAHPYDYLILGAFIVLAVAFIINQRRQAARIGQRPNTAVLIAFVVAAILVVVGGALLITS